jgi:hypothetical protein
MSSEGFSALENTLRRDMFSEGNAAHPVGCDSPLQIVMAISSTIEKFEICRAEHKLTVWRPAR